MAASQETKIIYHKDEQDTPYCVRVPVPADQITLGMFKEVLDYQSKPYKYFFKSPDDGKFT